ncbi:MAG: TadE family protein, partial [Candidatus Limnocylindria bacterium]
MCVERGRGQSMVEFALILPIFILVLVGLFDVGRAVYAYNTVNNAAREAGRLAIVDQYEDHVKDEAVAAASGIGVVRDDVTVV